MNKDKLRRAPMLVAAAAVLPIVLSACSSGGSGGSSSDPSSAQGGAGSTSGTSQTGMAQFAQCMRQKGVTNFPDPQNGHFLLGGNVQSNPNFKSAEQACEHYLGHAVGANGSSGGNQQALLNFAHCMQTNGVPSFPDPSAGGALKAPQGGIQNSPTYKKAFNTCKSNLPGSGNGLGQ
jgi:hypothetical protein